MGRKQKMEAAILLKFLKFYDYFPDLIYIFSSALIVFKAKIMLKFKKFFRDVSKKVVDISNFLGYTICGKAVAL